MTSLHERVSQLETRLRELELALELAIGKKGLAQTFTRPTLEQAISAGEMAGLSKDEASTYWLTREASDWMRSTAGGGTTPVGRNWQADLMVFCKHSRQNGHDKANGTNGHSAKPESVWQLKTQIEAINEQLIEIDNSLVGAWAEHSPAKKRERGELVARRKELRDRISKMS